MGEDEERSDDGRSAELQEEPALADTAPLPAIAGNDVNKLEEGEDLADYDSSDDNGIFRDEDKVDDLSIDGDENNEIEDDDEKIDSAFLESMGGSYDWTLAQWKLSIYLGRYGQL